MYFTIEDYRKIERWLRENSVKDTEFPEVSNLSLDENLPIIQDNKNKKISLKNLITFLQFQEVQVDSELDINSSNPIQNQAVSKVIYELQNRKFIKIVEELPLISNADDNVVYILLEEVGEGNNLFTEWIKVNNIWEKVGEFNAEIDLTPYLKIQDSPFEKGSAENSAVLKGEYEVYSNKAISKTSMAVGAGNIAGLKGWYYSNIDFTNKKITLSDIQVVNRFGVLSTGSWSSETLNIRVGDTISLVNDSKFDFCSKVTAVDGNIITVDSLPFTSIASDGIFNNLDDNSVYIPDRPDAGIIDFGGGAFAEGGLRSKASNICAHAEGLTTHAYGQYSHAEGRETKAGYAAHAEGRDTKASGAMSHAEGSRTTASGWQSHAEGKGTLASGNISHAEGQDSKATNNCAHAEGVSTEATGIGSHSEGSNTKATTWQAHAEGNRTEANGNASHSEGYQTVAQGNYSHAEGESTKAAGANSHAEGCNTTAMGESSHVEGFSTSKANIEEGDNANTIKEKWEAGNFSLAYGDHSHVEGQDNLALSNGAHAEGYSTAALGSDSHTEGWTTTASGAYAHAEGGSTTASGKGSHAEGYNTTASKDYSHAEGNSTTASGNHSHAEGSGTEASAWQSHAEGHSTKAKGNRSHAEGSGTETHNLAEHAQGSFNKSTESTDKSKATQFSIGIGTSDTNRKNAVEVKGNGDVYIIGVGGYDGTNSDSAQTLQEVLANL